MSAVGFLGLGQIGAPMARKLLGRPGGLVVHDVRPGAVDEFVERGATSATTPAEVARQAQVVSVMVRDDAQVEEVVCGPDGLLAGAAEGTVLAIHSTIDESTAPRLAELAALRGVAVVDAPVSGGAVGAEQGDLAVMVGGTEEAFDRCREVFEPWAGLVLHAGGVGAGTRCKLARNLLHFVAFTAAAEAQRLAEAAGLDLRELGQVVRHTDAITGGPGAIMLRGDTAQLSTSDGLYPIFSNVRDLGEKDLSLALRLGERLGVELPLGERALHDLADGLGVAREER
ncbi:NAD(P)-dependent oxidoreductase [Saccharopolyspora rhizosphaerae]|uniref:NAD(P)-dependent oxidoreductase n=1 Tax=Saccharopolyspora rhizosphaerae TaxID=2492662 RepID=A0A3R8P0W4_9PSEU|nr:NAD(P)-dependent oxidoreductase [Saccharopolyspora rhizosphaerae]RRO17527.1 NAD(P)-dependent oxidoreductase [Saccharopolyspora rhizosphaerae]